MSRSGDARARMGLRLGNHLQLEMQHLPPVEWLSALMQIASTGVSSWCAT
ncbi:MAG: hypothetical protein K2P84_11430 [Undibacterium sp.]|nr:hypothetical protein [Undibacterium sp.]